MSDAGLDDDATAVLCETIASLHVVPGTLSAPAGLVPLPLWFQDLIGMDAVRCHFGNISRAAAMAGELLNASVAEEHVVLHGNVHHGNVLDFDGRWLAIDPKGLAGPRAFDYANIFCNPTADAAVSNFQRRLAIVSEHSGLDVDVIRSWVVAWCARTVTWIDASGGRPWTAHAILAGFG